MHALSLVAAAFAATMAIGSTALAADLDYDRHYDHGYKKRYSSTYDDHRYSDLYAPPPRGYKPAPGYHHVDPPLPIPPTVVHRERVYRYGRDDDRFEPRVVRRPEVRTACLARDEIKARLLDEGWRDFRDVERHGDVIEVEARRRGEDLYALKVDRCSGDIVQSTRLERPYAYDPGYDRPRRPYY